MNVTFNFFWLFTAGLLMSGVFKIHPVDLPEWRKWKINEKHVLIELDFKNWNWNWKKLSPGT